MEIWLENSFAKEIIKSYLKTRKSVMVHVGNCHNSSWLKLVNFVYKHEIEWKWSERKKKAFYDVNKCTLNLAIMKLCGCLNDLNAWL